MENQVIPSGKHAGRLLVDLTDAELAGLRSGWNGSKKLRNDPFFCEIERHIIDRRHGPAVKILYGKFAGKRVSELDDVDLLAHREAIAGTCAVVHDNGTHGFCEVCQLEGRSYCHCDYKWKERRQEACMEAFSGMGLVLELASCGNFYRVKGFPGLKITHNRKWCVDGKWNTGLGKLRKYIAEKRREAKENRTATAIDNPASM